MKGHARLALSLLIEPGDARLVPALAQHGPAGLLARVRAGDSGLPVSWCARTERVDADVDAALRRAEASGLRWVDPKSSEWPTALSDLDHVAPLHGVTGAPLGLWVRGEGSLVAQEAVAVVGARDCTPYGAEVASEIAADVVDTGRVVVSGAAFGIDAAAHRGALASGRPTIAVLACGADVDYPRAHAALLHRIAQSGLVVSEQPPGREPSKSRFLARNRIIAGLATGTVVVEARVRSGSLNTLHWADRLGRVTMAVPGPVTSQQSGGAHRAVRDGMAILVTGGADVVSEIGTAADATDLPFEATEFDRLPRTAREVVEQLSWTVPVAGPGLQRETGRPRQDVEVALALLEAAGLATRLDGGWVLARRADLA